MSCSPWTTAQHTTLASLSSALVAIHGASIVDLILQDLLAQLRPSLERLTEYEQAAEAVAAIEATEARSAASGPAGLGAIEEEDSDSDNSQDNSGSDSDAEGNLLGCAFVHQHVTTYAS